VLRVAARQRAPARVDRLHPNQVGVGVERAAAARAPSRAADRPAGGVEGGDLQPDLVGIHGAAGEAMADAARAQQRVHPQRARPDQRQRGAPAQVGGGAALLLDVAA
jgi:hypothetical protein